MAKNSTLDLQKSKKQIEEKLMQREDTIRDWQRRTGHARPMTRREFLNAGVTQFGGFMVLPSVLGILAKVNPAYAAQCETATATSRIPFVNINLSGGWSAVANWLPTDIAGVPLASYSQIGGANAPGDVPTTVTAFANNALFTTNSSTAGFLAGVRSVATADTISRTAFVGIPCNSNDDTGNNRFDVGGLLTAANLAGEKLPNMGQRDTPTGVGHMAAFSRNPTPPLRVDNFNDISGALGFVGTLASLNQTQQVSLTKLVKNLSDSQTRKLASLSGGSNIADLVDCATGKNVENVQAGAGNIDPRLNTALVNANIWTLNNGNELARAGMAMNAITGLAGAVGIEMGGYDYHGNDRANTDARDLQAGRLVGQVLQTAALLNRPVFIYLTSDGSVSFNGPDASGDSGNRGAALMLAYRPSGAPQAAGSQLGGFTAGQTVNTQFITGSGPEMTAAAVFANWAKLNGDTSLITKVIPTAFTTAQLNQVIVF